MPSRSGAAQVRLWDLMPPVATVPVLILAGNVVTGTVGLRSHSVLGDGIGWRADPAGKWFCVSWQEERPEWARDLSARLGLDPDRNYGCGLFVHEAHLQQLATTGMPFTPYQTRRCADEAQEGGGQDDDQP